MVLRGIPDVLEVKMSVSQKKKKRNYNIKCYIIIINEAPLLELKQIQIKYNNLVHYFQLLVSAQKAIITLNTTINEIYTELICGSEISKPQNVYCLSRRPLCRPSNTK